MYSFTIRDEIPALKNERAGNAIKLTKAMYTQAEVREFIKIARINRPTEEVKNFILRTKDKMRQTMQAHKWEVLRLPIEVVTWCELGVCYGTELPSSDVDNAWTTIQECLFTRRPPPGKKLKTPWKPGPVLEDDRQIGEPNSRRIRFVEAGLTYSKVYVSIRGSDEHLEFAHKWAEDYQRYGDERSSN